MAGGGTQRTSEQRDLPPEIAPAMRGATSQVLEAQQANPLAQFTRPNIQPVPGLSAGQQQAIGAAQGLYGLAGRQGRLSGLERYGMAQTPSLFDLASRRVTGENIQRSPSFQAANQAYEQAIRPGIENQAAVAGLGRSTALTNALAAGRAQYLQPTIEAELGREMAQNQAQFAGQQAAIQQAIQSGGLPRAAAAQGQQALTGAIQAGMATGETERGVAGEQAAAEYQDTLRRQALAEAVSTGMFGQLAPSLISSTGRTYGHSGLFK